MCSNEEHLSIYDVPEPIIERICQYLLDDPKTRHKWCSGGILHVLNFRASCKYLNFIIKNSYLKFLLRVCFYHQLHEDDRPNNFSVMEKFLDWANSDLNWKCSHLILVLPEQDGKSEVVSYCVLKLMNHSSIFSRQLSYLEVDVSNRFDYYCDTIPLLSGIFSRDIVLKIRAATSNSNVLTDLPFCDRIKIASHRHLIDLDPDMSKTDNTILNKVPDAETIIISDLNHVILRGLMSCKLLRLLFCHQISSPLDIENLPGVKFSKLEHFSVKRLFIFDFIPLPLTTLFPNLTSLTIDCARPGTITTLDLPVSCVTVKIGIFSVCGPQVSGPYLIFSTLKRAFKIGIFPFVPHPQLSGCI